MESICLLVDDEASIRFVLKAMLTHDNFQVFEAENGLEGWEVAQKLGDVLDLIVTDVVMPGGDGLTFAIKAREMFPALPIVIISGYSQSLSGIHPSPLFEFLAKPFDKVDFANAISNATTAMKLRKSLTCGKSELQTDDV